MHYIPFNEGSIEGTNSSNKFVQCISSMHYTPFNEGSIEGTNSLNKFVQCLCMCVLFDIYVGLDFVDLSKGLHIIYEKSLEKCVWS